jgi:hypothetical protein
MTEEWLVFGLTSVAGLKAQIQVIMKARNRSLADRLAAEIAETAGAAIVLSSHSGVEPNSFRVVTKFGPVPGNVELQALLPGHIASQNAATGPRRPQPGLKIHRGGGAYYLI